MKYCNLQVSASVLPHWAKAQAEAGQSRGKQDTLVAAAAEEGGVPGSPTRSYVPGS
jgi:hypothetical protein